MDTVIITGISRGIGPGLAARYLERGDSVMRRIAEHAPDDAPFSSHTGDSLDW